MISKQLLGLLFCITFVQAELKCKLRYDVRNYQNWYDFSSSFAYGLYDEAAITRTDCLRCDNLGNKVAELSYKTVDLEDQRSFWLNKENITGLRIFEMLTRLLQVYPLFSDFFTVVQELAGDPVIGVLGGAALLGTEPLIELVPHVGGGGIIAIYTMLETLPGSSCSAFGFKIGAVMRLAIGKSLPKEDSSLPGS